MDIFYWQSPHKQLFEGFEAEVVRVPDGDTIVVRIPERDFAFPIRFSNLSAREKKEKPERDTSFHLCADGLTSQKWLEDKVLGEKVFVILEKSRVDKWGRLLGKVTCKGLDLAEESINAGMGIPWTQRIDGRIPQLPELKVMLK